MVDVGVVTDMGTNADLTKKGLRLQTSYLLLSVLMNERRPDEEGIETMVFAPVYLADTNERRPDEEGIETK